MNDKSFKGFFVTGTDTDVGKTWVSRLLVEAFAAYGPVTYGKPVQTGCTRLPDGKLHAPDFEFLKKSSIPTLPDESLHVPYSFEPACSPHRAAELAGIKISIDYIITCMQSIARAADIVIVEGAGGVMAPLGPVDKMIDLVCHLDLPIILVTTPRLGTLNHTLLTIDCINNAQCRLAGVIMNNCNNQPHDDIFTSNIDYLKNKINSTPFAIVEHNENRTDVLKEFVDGLRKNYP